MENLRLVEEMQREREKEKERKNGELVPKSVVALEGRSIVFGSKWAGFYDPSSLLFLCRFLFLSLFFQSERCFSIFTLCVALA